LRQYYKRYYMKNAPKLIGFRNGLRKVALRDDASHVVILKDDVYHHIYRPIYDKYSKKFKPVEKWEHLPVTI
jgi:hypothetical protein